MNDSPQQMATGSSDQHVISVPVTVVPPTQVESVNSPITTLPETVNPPVTTRLNKQVRLKPRIPEMPSKILTDQLHQ